MRQRVAIEAERNVQFGWSKDMFDAILPTTCRKPFNAYWNDGTGRPFGKNNYGNVMNTKTIMEM